jgi:hypothetical protein
VARRLASGAAARVLRCGRGRGPCHPPAAWRRGGHRRLGDQCLSLQLSRRHPRPCRATSAPTLSGRNSLCEPPRVRHLLSPLPAPAPLPPAQPPAAAAARRALRTAGGGAACDVPTGDWNGAGWARARAALVGAVALRSLAADTFTRGAWPEAPGARPGRGGRCGGAGACDVACGAARSAQTRAGRLPRGGGRGRGRGGARTCTEAARTIAAVVAAAAAAAAAAAIRPRQPPLRGVRRTRPAWRQRRAAAHRRAARHAGRRGAGRRASAAAAALLSTGGTARVQPVRLVRAGLGAGRGPCAVDTEAGRGGFGRAHGFVRSIANARRAPRAG